MTPQEYLKSLGPGSKIRAAEKLGFSYSHFRQVITTNRGLSVQMLKCFREYFPGHVDLTAFGSATIRPKKLRTISEWSDGQFTAYSRKKFVGSFESLEECKAAILKFEQGK